MEGFLRVSSKELSLASTLSCGQCFRWKRRAVDDKNDVWFGIISSYVFELIQNTQEELINWKLLNPEKVKVNNNKRRKVSLDDINDLLFDYFQLKVPLADYYKKWSTIDDNFNQKGIRLPGIRMLRQDPVENLFSFICSSNNNIPRISTMVESLCVTYGPQLMDDPEFGLIYGFPTVESLAQDGVEAKLRKLNFGYRAKFISQAAQTIIKKESSKPEKWLFDLRDKNYEEAHSQLMTLPGVGAKVADCVCLMSLDKHDAIPVDTHIWKIATTDYLPNLKKNKTMTDKAYREVGNFFRNHFGSYAGWAHSVLFTADLKQFKEKT